MLQRPDLPRPLDPLCLRALALSFVCVRTSIVFCWCLLLLALQLASFGGNHVSEIPLAEAVQQVRGSPLATKQSQ